MTVEQVTEVDDALVAAFTRLVPQLSPHRRPPSRAELEEVAAASGAQLLVARDGDAIVGTLTLLIYRLPTGVRGHIDDVVVDEVARGRGVGAALTQEALRRAVEAGADAVDLTSRPEREAANRLYARLGFARRETNVYVWRPE
jgi:ribosomal protein S18 acetylase RimI-like enzyme